MVDKNRTNDQKCAQNLVKCQTLLIDMYWWESVAVLSLAMKGVCVYMRHAYETFQIAAGWSNICFKDVLQAPRTTDQSAQNNFKNDKEWDVSEIQCYFVCICFPRFYCWPKTCECHFHFGWAKVLSKMQWGRKTTVSEKGTCERVCSNPQMGKCFNDEYELCVFEEQQQNEYIYINFTISN